MAGTAQGAFSRLDGETVSVIFRVNEQGGISLVYFGPRLPESENLDDLWQARSRGRHESQPDQPPLPSLLPEVKNGYSGQGFLTLTHKGKALLTDFHWQQTKGLQDGLAFHFVDRLTEAEMILRWRLEIGDVLVVSSSLTNHHPNHVLNVDAIASIALPLPQQYDQVMRFSGRWAGEMHRDVMMIKRGAYEQSSQGGRPGFGGGNWAKFLSSDSDEQIAFHLAWSGDHQTRIEHDNDGQTMLLSGVKSQSGEIQLKQGETFTTPDAIICYGKCANNVSQSLHSFVRAKILPARSNWGPRKVHLNSWEALVFDLDEAKLKQLANDAASLGVERFVLDDGWFKGRRDATSSLGDWHVDAKLFPNGLGALISHVQNLGMDFGLWVEPEMINPDSDLYRKHPQWCVHVEGVERRMQRNQLVLDLTQQDVCDYLFDILSKLLRENPIAYLKWDHNRELFPLANQNGAIGIAQTRALYALMDRLRQAHPNVEIESCASGGGRIDYEILSRCHRVWASDNNDAIERLSINKGWSQFLPLEVMGHHVGPSPNPITGRKLEMDFRAKIAMFGHMGVEADPSRMSHEERDILKAHITLYKQWRDCLHQGNYFTLSHREPSIFAHMVLHHDKALALVAQTEFAQDYHVAPLRLAGLEEDAFYHVSLLPPWPKKAATYLPQADKWQQGFVLSGCALISQGLALPLTHPETAWLIKIERIKQ